jgi:hypothetical protein
MRLGGQKQGRPKTGEALFAGGKKTRGLREKDRGLGEKEERSRGFCVKT